MLVAGAAMAVVPAAAPYATTGAARQPQQQTGAPPQTPQPPGQRGRGRGRGAVQVMTLTTTSWQDGGAIPHKHAQAGEELSPPLAWSNVPEGVASFVLIAHDLDATSGGGSNTVLHWLVWNIPGDVTSLSEGIPAAPQLPGGARQISATGPEYRGPGAPASGPRHHYVFELYALDSMLEVPALGASPSDTRTAIMTAMAGHIRGKAVLVGLYKRI
jgi:Raf kinase inhibitor-like YbhB/YbcL family protein